MKAKSNINKNTRSIRSEEKKEGLGGGSTKWGGEKGRAFWLERRILFQDLPRLSSQSTFVL